MSGSEALDERVGSTALEIMALRRDMRRLKALVAILCCTNLVLFAVAARPPAPGELRGTSLSIVDRDDQTRLSVRADEREVYLAMYGADGRPRASISSYRDEIVTLQLSDPDGDGNVALGTAFGHAFLTMGKLQRLGQDPTGRIALDRFQGEAAITIVDPSTSAQQRIPSKEEPPPQPLHEPE